MQMRFDQIIPPGRHWLLALLPALLLTFMLAGCSTPIWDQNSSPGQSSPPSFTTYACTSGAVVEAAYPDSSTALLRYQGRERVLQIAVSASGARYVGNGLVWWTKGSGPGSEGMLFVHEPEDDVAGKLLEQCQVTED